MISMLVSKFIWGTLRALESSFGIWWDLWLEISEFLDLGFNFIDLFSEFIRLLLYVLSNKLVGLGKTEKSTPLFRLLLFSSWFKSWIFNSVINELIDLLSRVIWELFRSSSFSSPLLLNFKKLLYKNNQRFVNYKFKACLWIFYKLKTENSLNAKRALLKQRGVKEQSCYIFSWSKDSDLIMRLIKSVTIPFNTIDIIYEFIWQ